MRIPLIINDNGSFPWAARSGSRTYDDGAFVYYAPEAPSTYVFEILIDNTVVYSCSDTLPSGDISINTENYIGTHTLTFRLRVPE